MSDADLRKLRNDAAWLASRIIALLRSTGAGPLADAHQAALEPLSKSAPQPPTDGRARRTAAMERLIGRLDLKPVDIDIVLLAGMSEQHEVVSSLLGALHPRGEPWASVGLAARLFCVNEDERLPFVRRLLTGPATRSGLVSVEGDGPIFERTLRLLPSFWWVLGGVDTWPAALEPALVEPECAGLQSWLESDAARRADRALVEDRSVTVLVTADDITTAMDRAAALLSRSGRSFAAFRIGARVDPHAERIVSLHCLARGVVPVLGLADDDLGATTSVSVLESHPGVSVLAFSRHRVRVEGARAAIAVDAPRLDPVRREQMWAALVPDVASEAARLSARYTLEPAEARAVAKDAAAVANIANRELRIDDIAEAVRTRGSVTLSAGVDLVRPMADWEQLVLSHDRLAQLREAVARLERQSEVLDGWGFLEGRKGARGVRLLMAGPPGTGKTMSAEVLACTLGVDLLVVDISRVVSKWIGETEKNLARVFDLAERTQAVLLFDEADALFGKRTEVSDAHDRYANLETAFLLSRLERLEGMAVLSTNLRQNIDAAFLRRLEFVIDFEEPEAEERLAIWKKHIPGDAPLADDVDLEQLADLYPVVGGLIRNAAVAAGFVAASEKTCIHQRHFIRALRREYDKAGRSFPGLPPGFGPLALRGGNHAHDAH